MDLYNGLVKFNKNNEIEDVVVIDDNFSFNSLILNPFWFVFHKMWLEFFCVIIIAIFFNFFATFGIDVFLIESALLFMVALNSKTWLQEHLIKRKKYQIFTMVFAKNCVEAKLKIVDKLCENNLIFNENSLGKSSLNWNNWAFRKWQLKR